MHYAIVVPGNSKTLVHEAAGCPRVTVETGLAGNADHQPGQVGELARHRRAPHSEGVFRPGAGIPSLEAVSGQRGRLYSERLRVLGEAPGSQGEVPFVHSRGLDHERTPGLQDVG